MVTRFEVLCSWIGFPIYAWQGLKTRRKIVRMNPPPHSGWITAKSRKSKNRNPVRILVVGDSSAAGVGVSTIDESLAGHLAPALVKLLNRDIHIRIAGMNSATSADIRDHVVRHIERDAFDFIALNLGTNDAKNFHSGRRFCREFGTLLYALKARFPSATIVWAGVINLAEVPALPKPLNKILGIRSRIINRNGKILCEERGALAPMSTWRTVRENFAEDGFHASSQGYREWAEDLAHFLAQLRQVKP